MGVGKGRHSVAARRSLFRFVNERSFLAASTDQEPREGANSRAQYRSSRGEKPISIKEVILVSRVSYSSQYAAPAPTPAPINVDLAADFFVTW